MNMYVTKKDFETSFTGWSFIVGSLLLWLGWMIMPHHIGEYIEASDFTEIGKNVWFWIWMYRVHIFGWVTMGIAIFSLVSITAIRPHRVLIIPGAGMIIIGTFTLAIAAAFFYNFGAAGVGKTAGMTPEEIGVYMQSIWSTNQYVTCFIRFGRIFSGVGFIILGAAFVKWKIVDAWLGWFTIIYGLVAMCVILFIPVNFEIYKPLFHVKALWLLIMGVTLLIKGIKLPESAK
ncbi:MAG: hypothetical protein WBK38_04855 [Bacteroidia bacterium]|jgi:hypothetical protein